MKMRLFILLCIEKKNVKGNVHKHVFIFYFFNVDFEIINLAIDVHVIIECKKKMTWIMTSL